MARSSPTGGSIVFLGLRTVIYPAADLDAMKQAFTEVLGFGPYFDEPFFVGFNVGGYELALDPNADPAEGNRTYWGVPRADEALADLLAKGATLKDPVVDVGEGIRIGSVTMAGAVIGIIENPVFTLAEPPANEGPGR